MLAAMRERGERPDFDSAYEGTPPWDIGRPQPAFARLAEEGAIRGSVLDAGCGTGEHALLAAGLGLETLGIDLSPRAIALARGKAADRGLKPEFAVWDALALPGLGRTFDTVIDSGLFHVFDDDSRARYEASLREVVREGGRCFILCFSDRVPGGFGPRRIGKEELLTTFADGWHVDPIEAATMSVRFTPDGIPAWLATITRTADETSMDAPRPPR